MDSRIFYDAFMDALEGHHDEKGIKEVLVDIIPGMKLVTIVPKKGKKKEYHLFDELTGIRGFEGKQALDVFNHFAENL